MSLFKKYKESRVGRFLKDYAWPLKYRIVALLFLSTVIGVTGAAPSFVIKYLTDDVLVNKNQKVLLLVCLGTMVIMLFKGLSAYYTNLWGAKISGQMTMNIRGDMYEKVQNMSFDYFSESKSGDVMSRFGIDTDKALTILSGAAKAFADMMQVIFSLIIVFVTNPKLAVIAIVLVPMVSAIMKKYSRRLRNTGKDIQESFGKLNTILQEGITGIRVIKAFATEKFEIEKYKTENSNNFYHLIRNKRLDARIKPMVEYVNIVVILAILYYGGTLVIQGKMTSGDLMKFITAFALVGEPLKRLSDYINALNSAIPAVDRLYEILELESTIENKENPYIPKKIEGIVEFENLDFAYNSERDVLKNLNLSVKQGEMVALVGRSGSGKTTLVNLIPRFYDATNGSIKIDGIDTRDYDVYTLRKNIGVVPQETFLFSGSVRDTIIYGKRNASDEEIEKALRMANAYNFVMELPQGLNTEVGERGVLLSGGQKQRLAIARAILENPPIMILDEATSALDTESERLVQDALDKLMTNRTTFVIAHRLSTILHADKIVVMENGEIMEVGTHNELLNKKGIYTKLYETQFGKLEEETINA
ncbi:MAG: ABC transporter ATP-binding protein [Fusobacteriaceae bacterium]|nr:ABC transporter ATP-binding protein [Fusobacteriaceae bacterium]MBP6467661.1 ABC transporter ATP-binding protein [Fusobacteriaceae bacterium]MBU9917828.1 ABC transporter ATP-binding protein/permease [Fusobacteriaceae bacterium]